jgi:hypothetical protein
MPPVRSIKNQYSGLNAHLHSLWQADGNWDSFHALHISDLAKSLNASLLPLGYSADVQKSLQIRRSDEPQHAPYWATAIYEHIPRQGAPGEPVAWVELLSPSNKPGDQDAD